MKLSSQHNQLLNYFHAGGTITKAEAFNIIHSTKADTRISELRALGYKIDDYWESGNGKRWKRYYMAEYRTGLF